MVRYGQWLTAVFCCLSFAVEVKGLDEGFTSYTFQVNSSKNYSKIKCLILAIGKSNALLNVGKLLKYDLEFSDQLDVELKKYAKQLDQAAETKLFSQGYSLCLYLKEVACRGGTMDISIQLRDTSSGQVFFDKNFIIDNATLVGDSHTIADQLMPILTGENGPFLSTLAYCKQLSPGHKVVCLADFACKTEKVIVPTKRINVAPCWHSKAPLLFYSQFTRRNSRLMSYDIHSKKSRIICSYDGLSMQPSFSQDGVKAVLCMSAGGNSELYRYDERLCSKYKKKLYTQITKNGGNNVSPCLLPNDDIVFCSDFETGKPQLYYYKHATKTTHLLTNGRGYCAAPSYCPGNNQLVYTRMVKGVFQLFTLDLATEKHVERQLTFGHGDKIDPSWSPCGGYVAFSYGYTDPKTRKHSQQIAVLNMRSGKQRILTTGSTYKAFPAWTRQTAY